MTNTTTFQKFFAVAVVAAVATTFVNRAEAFPPVPPVSYPAEVTNATTDSMQVQYKPTYGACAVKGPKNVTLSPGQSQKTTVTCPFGARGEFAMSNASTKQSWGNFNASYGKQSCSYQGSRPHSVSGCHVTMS